MVVDVPLDTDPQEEGLTVIFKQEMAEGHTNKTKSKTTPIIAAMARFESGKKGAGANTFT